MLQRNRKLPEKARAMLYAIALVLLVLWALGLMSSFTMGGLIHALLAVALVVVLVKLISEQRTL